MWITSPRIWVESLSAEKILEKLEENPIWFLYNRREIWYFYEDERKNLRLSVWLWERLTEIFSKIDWFISDPVESLILIINNGKNLLAITQFDKDVRLLWLKQSDFYTNAEPLWNWLRNKFMSLIWRQ